MCGTGAAARRDIVRLLIEGLRARRTDVDKTRNLAKLVTVE
jgi:hypothetical protein